MLEKIGIKEYLLQVVCEGQSLSVQCEKENTLRIIGEEHFMTRFSKRGMGFGRALYGIHIKNYSV